MVPTVRKTGTRLAMILGVLRDRNHIGPEFFKPTKRESPHVGNALSSPRYCRADLFG